MCTLKTFLGLVCAALLAACGGGGSSSPTASPSATTPSTGSSGGATVQSTQPPAPVNATIAGNQFVGRVHILAQNAVVAPSVSASAPPLPTTSAGSILATPVNQVISLNRSTGGQYFGGSDESGTYLIDPASVDKICGSSFQVGLAINGSTSRACAAPDLTADTVTLPGTCSKDVMFYTWHLKDGRLFWFDLTSERKFTVASGGLPGTVLPNGGQINWGGYIGATLKVTKTAVGRANLRLDFGSNCGGGFGKNDHLIDVNLTDPTHPLAFGWNGTNAAQDGGEGWGLIPWTDKAGNMVTPSAHLAYPGFDGATGNFFVEFSDLPIQGAGSVTGYRGTKNGDNSVTYDPELDSVGPFGFGWLAIQAKDETIEPQIWTLLQDPSCPASFDRTLFQLKYSCH